MTYKNGWEVCFLLPPGFFFFAGFFLTYSTQLRYPPQVKGAGGRGGELHKGGEGEEARNTNQQATIPRIAALSPNVTSTNEHANWPAPKPPLSPVHPLSSVPSLFILIAHQPRRPVSFRKREQKITMYIFFDRLGFILALFCFVVYTKCHKKNICFFFPLVFK